MENRFLNDLQERDLETPVLYMLVNGDSYFDVYDDSYEDYGFKDEEEAWEFISKDGFGEIEQVRHEWTDTDLAKIVWYVEKYDEYYSAHVPYSSYEGYYIDSVKLKRVFPKEKTITIYE